MVAPGDEVRSVEVRSKALVVVGVTIGVLTLLALVVAAVWATVIID